MTDSGLSLQHWLSVVERPLDAVGLALYLLVFPIYHAIYPWLGRLFPNQAAKHRIDRLRRSWIEGLIERRDFNTAAQQTRNLTMVNSLIASSTLILMGLTANVLIRVSASGEALYNDTGFDADTTTVKLYGLVFVFVVAFAYCMTALRHLGHFNVVIGADPKLVEELEGSSVDYFTTLINRASNRYTLGVRCLFSAFPLFLWLFDSWLFVGLTLFWGIKFIGFQDFRHVLRQRRG